MSEWRLDENPRQKGHAVDRHYLGQEDGQSFVRRVVQHGSESREVRLENQEMDEECGVG